VGSRQCCFLGGEISLFFQKEIANILEFSGVNLINFLFFWFEKFPQIFDIKNGKKKHWC
jgi:hypothetical protein